MKNLHLVSLGCPKTRVDSEVMLGLLRKEGWQLTPDPEQADAILVSTCAFLQSSIEESIDEILECADYKSGRCKRLIVAGCLPSRFRDQMAELKASLPEVDTFLMTNELQGIIRALEPAKRPDPDSDYFLARELAGKQSFAYLKISEGCNRRCSFCAIPLIRGKQISRPIDSLVRETRYLAEQGVKEIVLVAQELTGYGSDLGMQNGLIDLLDAIEPIDGIEWIRLMYTYPWNFTDALIERIGQGKILPYVDIPLQHVSQHILDDMRRHVEQKEQDRLIRRLREIPGMVLRTSLIAGYPGETEADVDELEQWMKEIRFDRLGIFEFSPEDGTPAGEREDQIPEEIRTERRDRLMAVQQQIHAEKMEAMIGQELTVLVDGISQEHELVLEGRYYGQAPEVDGKIFLSYERTDREPAETGDMVQVEVVEASEYDLVGAVLEK
ncbi:MAG: 30S ribosomal protein S12 methylthiotransferase RimO [Proteobacteria bacterium]|nr:30S ribosomal protein S12 methylthiotransferase RimO [Pseudomonadota bacterium]